MTSHRRLPPFLVALAPLLALTLLASGPFRGCSGGRGDAPALPHDPSGCFDDDDCVPEGCADLRCVAGTCTRVADVRDGDGDGRAVPPCGTDCNDEDSSVYQGAAERCDLVDQDCDGRTDEMASPAVLLRGLTTEDPTMIAVGWDDRVLVTDDVFSMRGVRVRLVGIDGTLGTPRPLLDTASVLMGGQAAPIEGGAIFALLLRDAMLDTVQIAIVRALREPDGRVRVADPPILRSVGEVTNVALRVVDARIYLAWDETGRRILWSPDWAAEVTVTEDVLGGFGPLDLESDGTHLVLPSGPRVLSFHSTVDGARVGTRELDGELAPGSPLASAPEAVLAIRRDFGDYVIQRVTLAAAHRAVPLPSGGGISLQIETLPGAFLLLRTSGEGVRAWLLNDDLEVMRTYTPDDLGARGTSLRTQVGLTRNAVTILTNYGYAGSSLAVLACGL